MRAWSRPSAEHVAMAVAGLWLVLFGVLNATAIVMASSLLSVAPLIAAAVVTGRRVAIFAGAAVALVLGLGWWHHDTGDRDYWIRVAGVGVVSAMAVVGASARHRREQRLARMTAIAEATQLALLPPLPPEMAGINIAARYRSAAREASVGGDLYEIIPTGHGIRVIIGDVRGKGLDAVRLAGHVLSAFRRSAAAMPAIEQVGREVGRALGPHLGDEDFVTAVLAEITATGELSIVNRGHHPPLLGHCGDLRPLTGATAALPLGLDDDCTAFPATWSPGDRLLLYTDGLVDSRDPRGHLLPDDAIRRALAAPDRDQALDTLISAVHRHTGGNTHDDMALLLLENGGSPGSAHGHPTAIPRAAAP